MKAPFLLLVVTSLSASPVVRGALEFCGYLSAAGELRFVIANAETGQRSTWLAIGETFQGHRVVGFEIQNDTIILLRDSHPIRLPLKVAGTVDKKSNPPPNTINVAIGDHQFVSVLNDPATFDALRAELRRAAAITPQPVVTLHAPPRTTASFITAILALIKECGVTKISIAPVSRE